VVIYTKQTYKMVW